MCLCCSTDLKNNSRPWIHLQCLSSSSAWGECEAHGALKCARVSEVPVTCVGSQVIQLSMEIIHSTLDKCSLMKSLAPFSLKSGNSLLLVSEHKEWGTITSVLEWWFLACFSVFAFLKVGQCILLDTA